VKKSENPTSGMGQERVGAGSGERWVSAHEGSSGVPEGEDRKKKKRHSTSTDAPKNRWEKKNGSAFFVVNSKTCQTPKKPVKWEKKKTTLSQPESSIHIK